MSDLRSRFLTPRNYTASSVQTGAWSQIVSDLYSENVAKIKATQTRTPTPSRTQTATVSSGAGNINASIVRAPSFSRTRTARIPDRVVSSRTPTFTRTQTARIPNRGVVSRIWNWTVRTMTAILFSTGLTPQQRAKRTYNMRRRR